MRELNPCPFCGAEPWGLFGPDDQTDRFWVECHGKDGNGMSCGDWYATDEYKTKEQVAEAWNRRSPAPREGEGQ